MAVSQCLSCKVPEKESSSPRSVPVILYLVTISELLCIIRVDQEACSGWKVNKTNIECYELK